MKSSRFFSGMAVVLLAALSGCTKNQDITHPDFDYQTVYFGTQFPVRTVELGEDLFVDNSLDNQHKVSIKATMGGVRENKKDVAINFRVDESLLDKLYFTSGGTKITPMPASYYKLGGSQIVIPAGNILGGVEVELTDAFFNDPLALVNTYAIPLLITNTKTGDSVLRGAPAPGFTNPNRFIDANWTVKPRDFVIYAVKFVNPWHGNYLRRGADVITGSVNQTVVRHKPYVENDEVNKLTTAALSKLNFPVVYKNAGGTNVNCTLQLAFDASGNCTVSSITSGVTATGSGKFVKRGEKNSWGNQDRDALYLNYTVDLTSQNMRVAATDTLVMRDRAVTMETFTPFYQQ